MKLLNCFFCSLEENENIDIAELLVSGEFKIKYLKKFFVFFWELRKTRSSHIHCHILTRFITLLFIAFHRSWIHLKCQHDDELSVSKLRRSRKASKQYDEILCWIWNSEKIFPSYRCLFLFLFYCCFSIYKYIFFSHHHHINNEVYYMHAWVGGNHKKEISTPFQDSQFSLSLVIIIE